jgi:hypothetical protein
VITLRLVQVRCGGWVLVWLEVRQMRDNTSNSPGRVFHLSAVFATQPAAFFWNFHRHFVCVKGKYFERTVIFCQHLPSADEGQDSNFDLEHKELFAFKLRWKNYGI